MLKTITQDARKILTLENVAPLSTLPIVGIEVEEDFGTDGEDALRVWIIIPDDTPDEAITGQSGLDLKVGMRKLLIENGIELFPYASLRTVTERKEDLEHRNA